MSARFGHLEAVKWLISNGAKLDSLNNGSATPFFIACQEGKMEVVRWFWENTSCNRFIENKVGATVLCQAAWMGHLEVVKFLYERGLSATKPNRRKASPLIVAAEANRLPVLSFLLSLKEVDVNCNMDSGSTALHLAAVKGHADIVRKLLSSGANVDENSTKFTPLRFAVINGHVEIVKLLLDAGANPESIDEYGSSPLGYAITSKQPEIVKMLLECNVDVNKPLPLMPLSQIPDRERTIMFLTTSLPDSPSFPSESLVLIMKHLICFNAKLKDRCHPSNSNKIILEFFKKLIPK